MNAYHSFLQLRLGVKNTFLWIVAFFFLWMTISSSFSSSSLSFAKEEQAIPQEPLKEQTRSLPDLSEKLLGKVISEVEIQGLARIEKDAILAKIMSRPGALVSPMNIRADIQAIFGMGFFEDIEVLGETEASGKVKLIYRLKERPVVAVLEVEGSEKVTLSDLKDVIKVKEWSILDINKVKEDTKRIQTHLEEKGYYLARVAYEVRSLKAGEVELVYKITDYEKVQIKKITFLNNNY